MSVSLSVPLRKDPEVPLPPPITYSEGGTKLPESLELLQDTILACFPNHGEGEKLDGPLLAEIIDIMGFSDLKQYLDLDEFRDVKHFVEETMRCNARNPPLVELCEEVLALLRTEPKEVDMFPAPSARRDWELRHATLYMFALHAVVKAVCFLPPAEHPHDSSAGPKEAPHLVERFLAPVWHLAELERTYFHQATAFQKLKKLGTDRIGVAIRELKTRQRVIVDCDLEKVRQQAFGLLLNMFMAMWQDLLMGRFDNAQSGYWLLAEMCAVPWEMQELCFNRVEWTFGGRKMGLAQLPMPMPYLWNPLYISWDLAVVSQFHNNPWHFAKLVAPISACTCYDTNAWPNMSHWYLTSRGVLLYFHIHFIICWEHRLGGGVLHHQEDGEWCDWRSERLFQLLGRINHKHAVAYHQTIEAEIVKKAKDRPFLLHQYRWNHLVFWCVWNIFKYTTLVFLRTRRLFFRDAAEFNTNQPR